MERHVDINLYPEQFTKPTIQELDIYVRGLAALLFLDEDIIEFKPKSVQESIKSVYKAVAIGVLSGRCIEVLNSLLPGKTDNLMTVSLLDSEGEDYYYNPDTQAGGWRE